MKSNSCGKKLLIFKTNIIKHKGKNAQLKPLSMRNMSQQRLLRPVPWDTHRWSQWRFCSRVGRGGYDHSYCSSRYHYQSASVYPSGKKKSILLQEKIKPVFPLMLSSNMIAQWWPYRYWRRNIHSFQERNMQQCEQCFDQNVIIEILYSQLSSESLNEWKKIRHKPKISLSCSPKTTSWECCS